MFTISSCATSDIYRNSPQNTAFFPNKKQTATLVKYRKRKIIENKCRILFTSDWF